MDSQASGLGRARGSRRAARNQGAVATCWFHSCRDNTAININETAPMLVARSPHTFGLGCRGACRGRNCPGLLGQACGFVSMLCSQL